MARFRMTERRAGWGAFIALSLWTALHLYWVFRTGVNWDEFALLARAHESLAQGRIVAGGRPGLGTLLLIPVAAGCESTLATVHQARLLWTPFGVGILVGFWFVLVRLFEARSHRLRDALVGVGLLAFMPPFLKFSLQVRTDQPAIMFGLFGGVILLASRKKPFLGLLSGALLAVGYLSSQKLIYVAALVGLLGAADVFINDRFRWRRELARIGLIIAGGLAMVFLFRTIVALFAEPASGLDVGGQMSAFAYYRRMIGYAYYVQLLPGLAVPVGASALVLGAAWAGLQKGREGRMTALLVFAVFGLGIAVAGFHAAALPYFWLTLGLFPATIVACGLPLLRDVLSVTARRRLLVFLAAAFLVTATTDAVELSRDGQALQRQTEDFVMANFPSDAAGFHTTRAYFCRKEAGFPTFFGQSIYFYFVRVSPDERRERVDEFIRKFREEEVTFMVRTFRAEQFPEKIRDFWYSHYVPYWGPIMVPGVEFVASRAQAIDFEVLVPGTYTLHSPREGASIEIDGARLTAGDRVHLEKGTYTIRAAELPTGSKFTLSLPSPPGPTTKGYYATF